MKQSIDEKSLVTIIVPVYNSEQFLPDCIESVISQTYKRIELLLINDGSTDSSLEVLHRFEASYSCVRVLTQENCGIGPTRNRGVKESTGKYLMFMDNDDYIEPAYVETMVNEIEQSNADMVVGGFKRSDENGKLLFKHTLDSNDWSRFRVIAPWARIMRRDFVLSNELRFGDYMMGEDSFFTVTAYNCSKNIFTTSYIGYHWIYRPQSVSNTLQKSAVVSPMPFLEELLHVNVPTKAISMEQLEYFVVKYLVGNLILIAKDVSKKQLKDTADSHLEWLNEHLPDVRQNPMLSINRPKGELFYIRFLVWWIIKSPRGLRNLLLCTYQLLKKMKK